MRTFRETYFSEDADVPGTEPDPASRRSILSWGTRCDGAPGGVGERTSLTDG